MITSSTPVRPRDCDQLFCPSYTTAVSPDPFSGQNEYFLSVGLELEYQSKRTSSAKT